MSSDEYLFYQDYLNYQPQGANVVNISSSAFSPGFLERIAAWTQMPGIHILAWCNSGLCLSRGQGGP